MNIEYLKLEELTPYEKNPRKNDAAVETVANSIKEFGFKVPIIIDKDNVIVCGHTRYKAAKSLNLETVPCLRADDLTDEQIKAFRLADNKSAEIAEWDIDLLSQELKDITDIDMEDFGFDIEEFRFEEDPEIEEDEVPEAPEEPKSKHGDIYQLGRHFLMCGDSTKQADIDKLMNGVKANLYVTDPPYNVNYEGSIAGKIQNDNMSDAAFKQFLIDAFNAANTNLLPGAAFYIWHADSEGFNFRAACREINWKVRECLIWNKNSLVLGRQDYQWKHEPCLYGWKDGAPHYFCDSRSETTVIDMDKPRRNDAHPTMKPVALISYLISNSSKKNDVVLDSFGGSGTTLIACEQLGRTCYTMELDPKFVDVIIERWEKLTEQKAVKISDSVEQV